MSDGAFFTEGVMMLSMTFSGCRVSRLMAFLVLPCCVFFASAPVAQANEAGAPVAVTSYKEQPLNRVQERAVDGDGSAELELGLRYVYGMDGVRDVPLGVSWIEKAAARGIPQAEHEMGSLYLMGVGVAQSNVMAVQWYRKAAIQGYAPSQTALGYAYEEGAGVPQNAELARYWFDKAAAHGNGIAVESLEGGM